MTFHELKRKVLPSLIRASIGLGLGILVLLLTQGWLFEINFLRNVDLLTIDYRYQSALNQQTIDRLPDSADVVIIEIGDKDSKALPESFPFPRSYYAHLIQNLNRAGAQAIIFDMTFGSDRDGDQPMHDELRRSRNVVLGARVETGGGSEYAEVRSLVRTYNNVFFRDNNDLAIGIVNIPWDRDNVVRRYLPMMTAEGELTPTLAFAALNSAYRFKPMTVVRLAEDAFQYRDKFIPRYNQTDFLLNYYGPDRSFRYVPFSEVIDDASFKTQDEIDLEVDIDMFDTQTASLLRNKIVIIGSVMPEERDIHNVPVYKVDEFGKRSSTMNGVEIHATAVQNVLDGKFVRILDPVWESIIIVLVSLFGFIILVSLKQLKVKYAWLLEIGVFLVILLLIGAIFETSVLLYSSTFVLINIVNPSVALVLAYLGTAVYQYLTERQQKALIKGVFSHYLNPSVVNLLVTDPSKAKLGGDRRELTVFFSDIAGFTTISEHFQNHPEGLVELLNEYLEEMTSVVLKYEGTLDKYEGDAIMSFWGAPIPQKDHALRACLASLEMQKRLGELRPRWKKEGKPELVARIGLNTGVVIVGNMGGKDRFDYTVIGDSVNLASRLEGANKQYDSFIMISEFTHDHVKDKVLVRELDLIQVKGKTKPVKVFELLGLRTMQQTEQQRQALEIYHEGLNLYRQKQWDESIAYMEQAFSLDNDCRVAKIYVERANLYKIAPPPEEWNGVFIMTTK